MYYYIDIVTRFIARNNVVVMLCSQYPIEYSTPIDNVPHGDRFKQENWSPFCLRFHGVQTCYFNMYFAQRFKFNQVRLLSGFIVFHDCTVLQ